ncbi:MAG: caspase family protein [Betaproteobacteria bacterium]|nr:caspase family protein [Betaproteobacteria bacterium]
MKLVQHWLFSFLCALALGVAHAGEPPRDPILRLETGMHTAAIWRIGSDVQGRWLVSASNDKTARVWDVASGRLLSVLRPPVDVGNVGNLYSAALSPDGSMVAVGGWTRLDEVGNNIYLFERSSGRLVRRITGLPNVIFHLAFSPSGRQLAASLGGPNGIRLFETATGKEVGRDVYGDDSHSVSFNADGSRLAASAQDGKVRVYSVAAWGLTRLAEGATRGGTRAYTTRFSPDGRLIALGYQDSAKVDVLNAETLELEYQPDTSGVSVGNLATVAWSQDGSQLMAVGSWVRNGQYPLRVWSEQGRGAYQDLPLAADAVFDLLPLEDGRTLFGASDPRWGVIAPGGVRVGRSVSPQIVDYRDAREGFRLSADGQKVRFGYEKNGRSPAVFELATLHLAQDAGQNEAGMTGPRTEAPGIKIENWRNREHPTLNGAPIKLQNQELSRSVAIAQDGSRFAIGGSWSLRFFDATGKELWKMPAQGAVWNVNISRDGYWVVASYADGIIRWHRSSDGKELLSLFPHNDRKRWVLWTPSGYFAASPGGEDLIGWHLNRGKDGAADFFPVSRFRAQFFRPDLIAQVLQTQDETEALRLANADSGRRQDSAPARVQDVLPPVLQVLAPQDGAQVSSSTIKVRFAVRTPDNAPTTGVRVRVNGQALPEARSLAVVAEDDADVREINVPIPAQDSEIQLFAENRNGVSTPGVVRVHWAGAKAAPAPSFKPKLYVLAVGVSKYANSEFNLGLAAKDARDFAATLQKQQGQLYSEVKVRLITDDKATKDDVLDGLDWLRKEVTARDMGMMFMAGHGMNDNTGNYFFLPHNADPERLLRTGVAQSDIKIALNTLPGKAVFFVDTCHSGNALGSAKTRGAGTDINAFVNELASAENGVVVFTAATGRQFSLEDPSWGNGAFTKAVIEGLNGKADFQKTGKVTHKGLDYYVAERVKELTRGRQSPVSIAPSGVTDFPIAVVR